MKEAKFTPGPWIDDGYSGKSHQIIVNSKWGEICRVAYIGNDLGHRNANAHLIAAAPDLLEALETVLTDLLELHQDEIDADHYGDSGCEYCEHITEARAAITKALGED